MLSLQAEQRKRARQFESAPSVSVLLLVGRRRLRCESVILCLVHLALLMDGAGRVESDNGIVHSVLPILE